MHQGSRIIFQFCTRTLTCDTNSVRSESFRRKATLPTRAGFERITAAAITSSAHFDVTAYRRNLRLYGGSKAVDDQISSKQPVRTTTLLSTEKYCLAEI